MRWWRRIWPKGPGDAERTSELRFHIDELTLDKMAEGLPPEEARRAQGGAASDSDVPRTHGDETHDRDHREIRAARECDRPRGGERGLLAGPARGIREVGPGGE